MSERIEQYRKGKQNIDINKIKSGMSLEILAAIITEEIDYKDLATEMGLTSEELVSELLNIGETQGSEILMIDEAVERVKQKIKEKNLGK